MEFFSNLLQVMLLIIILLGVLFLTYVFTKKLALFRQGSFSNKNMKIIEVIGLSPGQYIYIVEIAKRYYVFSSTKERLTYCFEIDDEALDFSTGQQISFEAYLKKFITSKQENKNDKD
jgi:flagellar biogenesis protein FliO